MSESNEKYTGGWYLKDDDGTYLYNIERGSRIKSIAKAHRFETPQAAAREKSGRFEQVVNCIDGPDLMADGITPSPPLRKWWRD